MIGDVRGAGDEALQRDALEVADLQRNLDSMVDSFVHTIGSVYEGPGPEIDFTNNRR
jgi:hypothetical protein